MDGSRRSRASLRSQVELGSFLALMLAVVFGAGAPPSEFAPRTSIWWSLEPLMFPALGGGVVLALVALVANALPSGHRVGVALCLAAAASTAVGTVVASGISDRPSWKVLAVSAAFLVLPGLAAVHALVCGRNAFVEAEATGQQAVAPDDLECPRAGQPQPSLDRRS